MSDIPIRVETAHWDGLFELSDWDGFYQPTAQFRPMFERVMEREWAGLVWNDDDGGTLRLPFCRATETMDESGKHLIFVIGMKRTYADGRRPGDALCARIHAHAGKAGHIVTVEALGGAQMRLLYCEVLRLIAWLHPAFEAELSRCETLAASEQAAALTLPPITDPIDQAIYKIIVAADFDITDGRISARLSGQGITLSREKVNIHRNTMKKMGYQVRL